MQILLVDDEPQLLGQMRRLFESRGYSVDTASTGKEALEKGVSNPYDLLVLDWGLPDLQGIDVVTALRKERRRLPILMLTGRDGSDDIVRALDAGADDFVTKSAAGHDVLFARTEALARRAQYAPAPRRIVVGAIVVDEVERIVTVDGVTRSLTPSELRMLAMLVSSMGKLVTRGDLVLGCWGDGVEVSDNALESVVKRIRRKLGTAATRLQAVRMKGYVLTDE